MKFWRAYGSEHSMNLVMVGHFKDAGGALEAQKAIDLLKDQAREEAESETTNRPGHRFSEAMFELLKEVEIFDLRPDELDQLNYDFSIKLEAEKLILTTEESDVSAFLKIMIDNGARVEVYSTHHHPGDEHGRGK